MVYGGLRRRAGKRQETQGGKKSDVYTGKVKGGGNVRIIPLLAGKDKHHARASLSLGKLFLDFSFNPFQFFLASQPSFFDLGKLCFDFCQLG